MVATTNYPGSSDFHYFVGNKDECKEWMDKWYKKDSSSKWLCMAWNNRSWRGVKYRDGQYVIQDSRVNPSCETDLDTRLHDPDLY